MKIKDLILFSKPHIWAGWLYKPLKLISNTIELSRYISGSYKFSLKRNYNLRYDLYKYILDNYTDIDFDYLEFGVGKGLSLKWWEENSNATCYGFDSFEGLPEKWGRYNKGSMKAPHPTTRAQIHIGLFQETLPQFLKRYNSSKPKIIHMDADLFTSSLYVLTMLVPYLNCGDVIIFDEFNCPNHEFNAFKIFCDSYYISPTIIGERNNCLQIAFQL